MLLGGTVAECAFGVGIWPRRDVAVADIEVISDDLSQNLIYSLVLPVMRYEKLAVSRPRPDVWMLTLNSPPDNRFTVRVLAELSAGLDQVEGEWRLANKGREPSKKSGGAIVIASALVKFFSNGYEPDIVHGPGFITGESHSNTRVVA